MSSIRCPCRETGCKNIVRLYLAGKLTDAQAIGLHRLPLNQREMIAVDDGVRVRTPIFEEDLERGVKEYDRILEERVRAEIGLHLKRVRV